MYAIGIHHRRLSRFGNKSSDIHKNYMSCSISYLIRNDVPYAKAYVIRKKSGYFSLASTAVVLCKHLPRSPIRTPDLQVPRFYPLSHRVGTILILVLVDR